MSERNGDRARFQKERMRKMLRRQRIQALTAAVRQRKEAATSRGDRTQQRHPVPCTTKAVRYALATEQTRPDVAALMAYRLLSSWRC